jgi:hypothetical protein
VTTVTFNEVEGGQIQAYKPYYIVVSTGGATINGQGGSVEQHQTAGSAVIDDASYQFKGSTVTIDNATLYDEQKPAYILQSDGWWHKVPQNQSLAYVVPSAPTSRPLAVLQSTVSPQCLTVVITPTRVVALTAYSLSFIL